jgi:uncharacterized membrane protein YcaP (DUF421 family)
MKKLERLLQTILITLSVYLLFRLFGNEEFNRLDYVWMIILFIAGIITILNPANRKRKEN